MVRNVAAVLLAAIMTFTPQPVPKETVEVSAKAAVLMEADSMRVIYGLNEHERLPMASTTKIMTAMLALEYPNLDKTFEVDSTAIHVEGSTMGLTDGDIVTMRALAYGMILPSGNDAANATAVALCGSQDGFVLRMNERAKLLKLNDTQYKNPSGLDAPGHYSSAYDLAALTSFAFQNPDFMSICRLSSAKVSFGNPPYTRWLTNHNKLITMYDGCIGVKTGFTDDARRCLVSAAERDGVRLICVTLNDPDDWRDHSNLFDYGFAHYKSVKLDTNVQGITIPVMGGEKNALTIRVQQEATASLNEDELKSLVRQVKVAPVLFAPIKKDAEIGSIQFQANGVTIKNVKLLAAEDIPYKEVLTLWERITKNFK